MNQKEHSSLIPPPSSLSVAGVNPDPLPLFTLFPGYLFLPRANVAERGEHLRLFLFVLFLSDVADFPHHLQLDEALLPHLIVEHLFVGHGLDLAQDPVESGDGKFDGKEEDVVEQEHSSPPPEPSELLAPGGLQTWRRNPRWPFSGILDRRAVEELRSDLAGANVEHSARGQIAHPAIRKERRVVETTF